jgi:hypothetical protein
VNATNDKPRRHRLSAMAVFLLALAAAGLTGCGRGADPVPQSETAASKPQEATMPTPVLDAWEALRRDIEDDPEAGLAVAHTYPLEASLKVDEHGGPDQRRQTIEALQRLQPLIERAITLAQHKPEDVPRPPVVRAESSRGDPWRALSGMRHVLAADASRCFDEGDGAGAAARLEALVRIGTHQITQGSNDLHAAGIGNLTLASRKTLNMLDAGLLNILPTSDKGRLRSTFAGAPIDPAGYLEGWENLARAALEEVRAQYGGSGGATHLRALIQEWGVEQDAADATAGMVGRQGRQLGAAILVNPGPRELGRLSARDIDRSLREAELLIPRAAAALRVERSDAWEPIIEAMRNDRAQLTKLVIGAPGAVLSQLRGVHEDIARVLERLNAEP